MRGEHRVYVLALRDIDGVYIGETANLSARLLQHQQGLGSAVTKEFGVRSLLASIPCETREAAKKLEGNLVVVFGPLVPTWGASCTQVKRPWGWFTRRNIGWSGSTVIGAGGR